MVVNELVRRENMRLSCGAVELLGVTEVGSVLMLMFGMRC